MRGNITEEDFQRESNLAKRMELEGILPDVPDYDRVERGIRLHDVGRVLEKMGVISSAEHHFASLFIALQIDPDPIVCEAVLNHVLDVLPSDVSDVSRHVRDIDRMAGSGYIGLIRAAIQYGFRDEILEERDEDKIIRQGIMMTVINPNSGADEDLAEKYFWEKVHPFFELRGQDGLLLLGDLSKIILDRIFGRNYAKRGLDVYERRVLKLDYGTKVVEPVQEVYIAHLNFKIKNTIKVLVKTRGESKGEYSKAYNFLTSGEQDRYLYYR